jgi:hypothetical protein
MIRQMKECANIQEKNTTWRELPCCSHGYMVLKCHGKFDREYREMNETLIR